MNTTTNPGPAFRPNPIDAIDELIALGNAVTARGGSIATAAPYFDRADALITAMQTGTLRDVQDEIDATVTWLGREV